nr:hypothetical protein [Tanacetum cinerariifolium]
CGDSLDGILCQRCTCKSCRKGAHYGYNCLPKVSIISNLEPCHNQNVEEFPQTLPSFHLTCYSGDQNSFAYDSTPDFVNDSSNAFNPPSQPPMYSYEFYGNDAQYGHDCPPQVSFIYNPEPCYNQDINFPQNFQVFNNNILVVKAVGGRGKIFNETNDSLIMGDEHLDTIPEKKSDEFIKSIVENLVPNPSESEDLSNIRRECDVPVCDDFTTFSNLLFDADDDFSSSDDELFSDEDIPKEIYSNHLFYEEIISIKIDPHHFILESDLIESLLNQDSLIISSSKIDSLLDEFVGELIFLNSIPSRIDEAECDPEEEILLSRNCCIDCDYSDSEGDKFFPERLLHDDPIPLSDILDYSNVVRIPPPPFFTYPVTSSILLSSGSEDTIFDPGISDYHFSSFMLGVSHRSETFMKFNVYPNHLNESTMEILSSTCSLMDQ